ncbi:ras-specific guanine nucleotide-releasing factor RalGPS1 [Trichonephila clavata]|uniref:Ras-specific guanine nucleotide-releasing factor RalGPS1 n=1 Tax=Trichonephila clavata TaxID=2740835 RepID=A0A8X6J4U2_TRICU|nr:ras-specific guanine nucleotide-releasing factor RalGPS1 [Trichonephila clavata]
MHFNWGIRFFRRYQKLPEDEVNEQVEVPSKIATFLNIRTRHIAFSYIWLRVHPYREVKMKHLILIDWEIFKNIKFEELSSCGWAWCRTESCAPNVVKFLERFNNITHWTVDTIFSGTTPAMRASVIKKFIKLIQHLHYRNDFHLSYAILFGLQIESIQRLHETWKLLSSNKVKTFKYFCSFYSSQNNYAKLRKYMEKLVTIHNFPCIPYLALYLEDLLKIHRENPGPAICNLRRITLMMDVIYLIQKFQKSSKKSIPLCHTSSKPEVRKYCLSINFSKEEQNFLRSSCEKISLKLEPA